MHKITNIDPETKAVYVTFTYGNHVLNHTVFVEDIDSVQEIKSTIEQHFEKFKKDIDEADNAPQLTPEVSNLIEKPQEGE